MRGRRDNATGTALFVVVALLASSSCDKPAPHRPSIDGGVGVASPSVAPPVAKRACDTSLSRVPSPLDLASFAVVATSDHETVVAESTIDHFVSTTYEVAVGPFLVRYTQQAPQPTASGLEVREASCDGPSLKPDPY